MTTFNDLARRWHEQSDHAADGAPFGSPTCNCLVMAVRIRPFLAEAWDEGHSDGQHNEHECREGRKLTNPYEYTDGPAECVCEEPCRYCHCEETE